MSLTRPRAERDSKVLVFGPQALTFDVGSFNKLRAQLHKTSRNRWALDTVATLPTEWSALCKSVPSLQHLNGETQLQDLNKWLHSGEEASPSSFPLPNILLSPLVVIAQLAQYFDFLDAGLPGFPATRELPSSITSSTETLGLCIGTLTAFAVSCSSSLAELQHYGAVAVRLAMLVGALVDAEEAGPQSAGKAMSFSVSWNSAESIAGLKQALENCPEAYISVHIDEKRATVTSSQRVAPTLIQQLKIAGLHIAEVALCGRFHWPMHLEDVRQAIQFCDLNSTFQLLDASKAVLPARSTTGGQFLTTGKLHEIALRDILLEQSQWFKTFSVVHASQLISEHACVLSFGPERCVPPTIMRKLGSRLSHVSDIDLTTSKLPTQLFASGQKQNLEDLPDDRVAVIGMACQVPGGEDLEEFWNTLCSGQSQHQEVPTERFSMETVWRELDPKRKWYGNFIKDYDTFDKKFFKKTPREMESTDPQHRLALQIGYQAVEQSGYFGNPNFDERIGCFMGVGNVDYENNVACYPATAYTATGNLKSFLAGKISHYFGWTGPSFTLDTACSSSSVAIHQACRSIINGECSAALAGGVNVITSPEWYQNLAGASFLSPSGQCKPFDAKGDGYCRGEGLGAVFLKKLSSAVADGDQVLGVIASSKVYQNRNFTAITVPNEESLSELFADAVRQARIEPKTVSVVEAHGTGTTVGDPAEFGGIRTVFGGSSRSDILSLQSVKGLVGHTECASGAVSLIKALLMIQNGTIPPQASFTTANPSLNLTPEDKIEISTRIKPWDVDFRAALINNYGASGSNAALVVTEGPDVSKKSPQLSPGKTFPFWFCGFDEQSLRKYAAKFRTFLQRQATSEKDLSIGNLSFQLSRQTNRGLPQALILNAESATDLIQKLAAFEKDDKSVASIQQPSTRPVILCFGGQISTSIGLDRDIYENATLLRGYLDQCDAMCVSLGLHSIYPGIFQRAPIEDLVELQTMLFAMQYSCAKAWIDSGVKPAALVGHSFGEISAMCVSNVVSLKDAIKMISSRARLIQSSWGIDKGSMMAVEADLAEVEALLVRVKKAFSSGGEPSIACYNGSRSFTLAGSAEAIALTEDIALHDPSFSGMRLKKLNVTNAFHCSLVDTLTKGLGMIGQDVIFHEPSIRLERSTEQTGTERIDARFLADHMRKPVYFSHAVQRLSKEHPEAIWLEAGSNSTITNMASRALGLSTSSHFQAVNITIDRSYQSLVDTTMKLWREGLNVTFWPHHRVQASEYSPVTLPPYQFEKTRLWMDLKKPPKLDGPIIEQNLAIEEQKGLTTFAGFLDKSNRSARFQINTKTDRFMELISSHIMANTVAVCPGVFQFDLAIDATQKIRPDFQDGTFQPQLQNLEHFCPLIVDDSKVVWIDAESSDADGLVWDWKLMAADSLNTTHHSSGTIAYRDIEDPQLLHEFEKLERLVGRKRCLRLLESQDADDVLQGRNIYRAFQEVIDYKEVYRNVTKLVGKDNESAGLVVKKHNGETWLDTTLADCFGQCAGIFVNLMSSKADFSERGIFIADGIDRWIRSPRIKDNSALPEVWEVFAMHHPLPQKRYVSDVFAFDPRDGSLCEVVLGISYQNVAIPSIQKMLSRLAPAGSQLAPTVALPVSPKAQIQQSQIQQPKSMTTLPPLSAAKAKQTKPAKLEKPGKKKATRKAPAPVAPNVAEKARDVICNLSGLDAHEVKDDSDLIEIGIDSLMAMELTREVEGVFKFELTNDQLMSMTTFASLVVCIQQTLGDAVSGDMDEEVDEVSEEESDSGAPKVNGHTNGMNGHMNGNVNGLKTPDIEIGSLPSSTVLEAFNEAKAATDDFIVNGQLGTYYNQFMPRSTALCVAHICNAFEKLDCPIRSAVPGQRLNRVPYLEKHQQLMDLIYGLLQNDARLIDMNESGEIIRTDTAPPGRDVETMLQELLRDEPVHAAENKLTDLIGKKYAECLTGKEDGLQMIFGSPEGREIVSDVYAKSPINLIWIQQAEFFLEKLLSKLPKDGETIRILEMGAGTGGTTSKIIPLLARLGVPVKYTMTDLSSSLVAAGRKRFKQHKFMEFKMVNIENPPDEALLNSQHIILATNCVHATRDLTISTSNIRKMLRPDGFLLLLEMTEQVPWVDFIFGLVEGWWMFQDGRNHALQPPQHWEKVLSSNGYGHVDWTDGDLPEANIQRLIIAMASGPGYDRPLKSAPLPAQPVLTDTAGRQTAIDAYIHDYTKDFNIKSVSGVSHGSPSAGQCVLVTGATGSLGSHVVACLVQNPEIHTVVCLNRVSTSEEPKMRQLESLRARGISLASTEISKLRVIATDTGKPMLGLQTDIYNELVRTVTHIVHSAWPMSITRPIRGYESQFKAMQNLIHLGRDASNLRPKPFKFSFQFISSIGTVSSYPLWSGKALVPEEPMTADSALAVGYADAKLACERMLDETLHRYPEQFRAMAVRIAQISGSTSNGYWNPTEHFVFLLKSSQTLKALPDLRGMLSWCPVNDVAGTLRDLLISETTPHPTYHIENPCRQPWPEMIETLADVLNVPRANIIPFEKWVERVRRFPGSTKDNPARQLIDFFEKHFVRMSCGSLVLDTVKSREHSETLRRRGPVSTELVMKYISAWKKEAVLS